MSPVKLNIKVAIFNKGPALGHINVRMESGEKKSPNPGRIEPTTSQK